MTEFVSLEDYSEKPAFDGQIGAIDLGAWECLGRSGSSGFTLFRRPIVFNKEGEPVAYEHRSEPA